LLDIKKFVLIVSVKFSETFLISFHSRTVHSGIIKIFIVQLNATLDYSGLKLPLKFTLKCSYMFRLTNNHQELTAVRGMAVSS
jgi:hypothetical protein